MTIYDVPVDDTVFFPVSGDMMRLMKFEEEQRTKNDLGSPAKNSPEAADPDHYQEERTVKNNTPIISEATDATWHPLWCTGRNCEVTPGEYSHNSAIMSTSRGADTRLDGLAGWEAKGDINLLDWNGDKTGPYAGLSLDGSEWLHLDSAGLTQLIGFLEALRDRLKEA